MIKTTYPRPNVAYVLPFALFMAALAFNGLLGWLGGENGPFWLSQSKYWVYPLQTILCAGVLVYFWKDYQWGPSRTLWIGAFWGIVVFFLWVFPQLFFNAPRSSGSPFDPYALGDSGLVFWSSIVARMLRLAIVVPLLEEIFWRGFLMRYFINKNFTTIPFGTPNLASFSAVVILFAFVHNFEDFFGALAAGIIYNAVAIATRSLGACVVAHAVTNLLLGIYVLQTRQWGFW